MTTTSNYALRLQKSLLDEVKRLAAEEGTTINQFINVAVAEKMAALRTEAYFRDRAARADLAEFEVYFGTSAQSLALQATLTSDQTSYPVPVVSGTIYFWEILSRDAEGNTSRSGVYSFRVL